MPPIQEIAPFGAGAGVGKERSSARGPAPRPRRGAEALLGPSGVDAGLGNTTAAIASLL